MTGALLLVLAALALLALRQSVLAVVAVIVIAIHLFHGDGDPTVIALDAWDGLNKDVLLSIPLFLLASALMARGSMAKRLVRVMQAVSGWLPGGLGLAAVASCALFAAVSGSATATLVAVGAVMYPALVAAGYSRRFAIGLLAAAGTLGIVIPPSIPLILYGVMTGTSISDLFLAGFLPGLALAGLLGGYTVVVNRRIARTTFDWGELLAAARAGAFALAMPLVVLGGIYGGFFTATEAAAVAVAFALVVERYVHRDLDWRGVAAVVIDTARTMGALFPILMLAFSLNVWFALEGVPGRLVEAITPHLDTPTAFLVAANVFLLAVGCLIDIGSAILLLAPLLVPLATHHGFDPVHFGIVMVVNLEIGYLTPPMGLNLIVAMAAFRESFREVALAVLPFIAILLAGLVLVSLAPALSLALVR